MLSDKAATGLCVGMRDNKRRARYMLLKKVQVVTATSIGSCLRFYK